MLARLARLTTRRPRLVLLAWLLVVIASLPFAARVGEVLSGQPDVPMGSDAAVVKGILHADFAQPDDTNVVLVVRGGDASVGSPTFERAFDDMARRIRALPGVTSLRDHRSLTGLELVAEDRGFSVALVTIGSADLNGAKRVADAIRAVTEDAPPLRVQMAGGPATLQEIERVSEDDARRAEVFGLPISLVILAVAFGALVASALPLIVAVTSITVSLALLYGIGQVTEFAVFTQTIVTMLGLATGIDYALLMVNRFREELRQTFDPRESAERAASSAGKAVAFSGLTVVVALSALLVPPLDFIRSIGIGTILVLLVSVLVSVTALPAALTLLGHRVNWLKVTRREPGMRSRAFWRARALGIMRRPGAWTVAGVVLLVGLGLPASRMQVADPGARGLAQATESRQVVTALEALGLEGMINPFDVLVDFGDAGFYNPANVRSVSQLGRALAGLPRVGAVMSPVTTGTVPALFLYQYYASRDVAMRSEVAPLARATVSKSGRYALVRVYPSGSLTPAAGSELHEAIAGSADSLGLRVRIGGAYVQQADWAAVLYRSFPFAVALVYLSTAVLLGLAFRSILIPLKAIVLNTLTVLAAYGAITLVFQFGIFDGLLGGAGNALGYIDTSAPLFIFSIVFGLSMDYEVFLVARIHEGHERGYSDREAVAQALAATGGVITSAAAIMITVFALLMFSHVVLIRTLGFGLAVAVLLDATLVRMTLVPAAMILAGRWNWWLPSFLARFSSRHGVKAE